MAHSWGETLKYYGRLAGSANPVSLEAPDRRFVGHRDILTRNLARYRFAAPYLRGRVLDIGSARGYGFEALLAQCKAAVGVDVSHDFLRESLSSFPDVPVAQASGACLPFRSASFESVVSFEVIEHVDDDLGFLQEIRRVARPGAVIAISTPNRRIASGEDTEHPVNIFHVREYFSSEFRALLSDVFHSVSVFGQYEIASAGNLAGGILDRVPNAWKYIIPAHIQGLLSVVVRDPLSPEDCHFDADVLEQAHSFLALCYV